MSEGLIEENRRLRQERNALLDERLLLVAMLRRIHARPGSVRMIEIAGLLQNLGFEVAARTPPEKPLTTGYQPTDRVHGPVVPPPPPKPPSVLDAATLRPLVTIAFWPAGWDQAANRPPVEVARAGGTGPWTLALQDVGGDLSPDDAAAYAECVRVAAHDAATLNKGEDWEKIAALGGKT
jgi:hypothetical protein